MVSVNLKALIGKLNDPCRRALEGAAGLCLSRTHYNVEVEHWLIKLFEMPNTDLTQIFRQYDIDTSRLQRDLTKAIDRLKSGNSRAPALSPDVVDLAREAWMVGSLEYGATKARSGHVLLALVSDENLARLAKEASAEFAKIPPAALQKDLPALTANSPEAAQPGEAPAEAGPGQGTTPGSKTPSLDQFTINLTGRAKKGEIDPVIGRDSRDPPDGRHPDPPPPEQPDPDRRGRRRQDGRRRGLRPADRRGRRAAAAQERRPAHARPGPAPGRRRRQGRVREPAQAGHRRGQGLAAADHPVHRRGAHHDRRRRAGRPGRRRQPAQAGPGPRRAAHHRRHHLGRVQEILREGRRPGPAVPGRQGRGAGRGRVPSR